MFCLFVLSDTVYVTPAAAGQGLGGDAAGADVEAAGVQRLARLRDRPHTPLCVEYCTYYAMIRYLLFVS